MKKHIFIVFVMLLMCAKCALAEDAPVAQAPKPVYLIIDIKPFNEDMYFEYSRKSPEIMKKYGGEYIVRGGTIMPFIGSWKAERIIIIKFPSINKLHECFGSPEYKEIKPLREKSSVSKAIIVEGV